MFGSQILEVAVGLVLVFLLVSLVLTAVRESIEALFKTRAADLEHAIAELLQDRSGGGLRKLLYDHPLIASLYKGDCDCTAFDADGRVERVGHGSGNKPSYIPRGQFALALLDLAQAGRVEGPVADAIEAMRDSVAGDLDRLRLEVEAWYDGAMDRVSGWYKRRTQKILFWLGLGTAIVLNLNALAIGQALATNPTMRDGLVAIAEGVDLAAAAEIDLLSSRMEALELPIGWGTAALDRLQDDFAEGPVATVVALLVGYLVTAFAATLGAPFWFDILNKVMVIRSTVKPAEKSGDEGSEDRPVGRAPAAPKVAAEAPRAAGAAGGPVPSG